MQVIINKRQTDAPHLRGDNWLSDPKRCPPITDGHKRDVDEATAVVWHTSKGNLVTSPAPSAIPSTQAERLALYQSRTQREVSWHGTVDTDGDVLQQADLELWTCWHAGWCNGWTVGFELVQREDAPRVLTVPQITAAADLTELVCENMGIRKAVLVSPDTAEPWLKPVKQLLSRRATDKDGKPLHGGGQTWDGVLGHCNVVPSHVRGPGDPGPLLFVELIRRGFDRYMVFRDGTISGTPLARYGAGC